MEALRNTKRAAAPRARFLDKMALILTAYCIIVLLHSFAFPHSLTTTANTFVSISTSTSVAFNKGWCKVAYGRRRLFSKEEERIPPALYSFPGEAKRIMLITTTTTTTTTHLHSGWASEAMDCFRKVEGFLSMGY